MIRLDSWITHLEPVANGVKIELVADTESAQDTASVPAIFLCHGRNRVSHAPHHPDTRHKVNAEVILVTVAERENQNLAGKARDTLTEMREPLIKRLVNWLPADADTSVRWNGGQLLNLDSTAIYWGDVFSCEYWLGN